MEMLRPGNQPPALNIASTGTKKDSPYSMMASWRKKAAYSKYCLHANRSSGSDPQPARKRWIPQPAPGTSSGTSMAKRSDVM